MNTDIKILKKIFENQIKQHIMEIKYYYQSVSFQRFKDDSTYTNQDM
jgi:hypothetical protein